MVVTLTAVMSMTVVLLLHRYDGHWQRYQHSKCHGIVTANVKVIRTVAIAVSMLILGPLVVVVLTKYSYIAIIVILITSSSSSP
jgi:hypothetical protein